MNKHILWPAALLLVTVIAFEISGADVWLQDYLYHFNTRHWLLQDAGIPRMLFYTGVKQAYIGFVLLLIAALLLSRWLPDKYSYQHGLWIVLLSTLAIPLTVNGLKAITNVPCPKQIERYGGNYPYVTVLSSYPKNFQQQEPARCYPAGHASGGFALLSLFFLFKTKWAKRAGLAIGLTIGWLTGGYKMLVGDHFLSHTIVTMILSWLLILLIAKGLMHLSTKMPYLFKTGRRNRNGHSDYF